MPSRDKKVISAKVSDTEYSEIDDYAIAHNMSIAAIIKLCIKGLIDGEIEIEKGELKTGVDPINDAEYRLSPEEFREYMRMKDLKFDRIMRAYDRREYTDSAIQRSNEQIESQILDGPKFNSRRRYDADWGC